MSERNEERLYQLIPAVYRSRDITQGGPLRALMSVLESQFRVLEGDLDALYDNWFIETCDEWVIPYIADLLGVRGLDTNHHVLPSQRAMVANTIGYRRRKGTIATLEAVARDASGWGVKGVEMFELIAGTQQLNTIRSTRGRTISLRDTETLAWIGTPFDASARSVDVRGIGVSEPRDLRGRYNLANIALSIWRLASYPVTRSTAFSRGGGRYTFDPVGIDRHLFNLARSIDEHAAGAGPINLPDPLRPGPLADELELRRNGDADALSDGYLDAPVLWIYLDGSPDPVPPEHMVIADLGDSDDGGWRLPWRSAGDDAAGAGSGAASPVTVAVDPVLGRFALSDGADHAPVAVSYAYGFPGDIGGGPYDRWSTLAQGDGKTWRGSVAGGAATGADRSGVAQFASLADALDAWHRSGAGDGVIVITDSRTYPLDCTIDLGAGDERGRTLVIEAADGARPALIGDLEITGGGESSGLQLSGLLIDGAVTVTGNGHLYLLHTTLVPVAGRPGIMMADGDRGALHLLLDHSIVGAIVLPDAAIGVSAADSIIDGAGGEAIAGARGGPPVSLERTTVLGDASMRSLEASDCIFTGRVTVADQHRGNLRFSYVEDGSRTPRRYYCQPDLAYAARAEELGLSSPDLLSEAQRLAVAARLRPRHTSVRYGDAGYCQLVAGVAHEIGTGAENGEQMGAFNMLRTSFRAASLRGVLDEYLPLGTNVGIFYIT